MNKRNSYTEVPEDYNKCLVFSDRVINKKVTNAFLVITSIFIILLILAATIFKAFSIKACLYTLVWIVAWYLYEGHLHEYCHFYMIRFCTGYKANIVCKKPILIHKYIIKDLGEAEVPAETTLEGVYLNKKASLLSLLAPFVIAGVIDIILLTILKAPLLSYLLILYFHTLGCSLDLVMAYNIIVKCNDTAIIEFAKEMRGYQKEKE